MLFMCSCCYQKVSDGLDYSEDICIIFFPFSFIGVDFSSQFPCPLFKQIIIT